MTQFLPNNLLLLFEARPPLQYVPPVGPLLIDKNRKRPKPTGMGQYVSLFEDPDDTPPKPVVETRSQRRERRRREKEELLAFKVEQGIAQWSPAENENATEDPYKTLFVSRINYETSENKLKREFETFGKIKKLTMVHDPNGKPRGYAFIEYMEKNDMHNAYKRADGMKVDGRRLVVDYERGRTQKTWLPRRLGGGKGDTRRARESKAVLAEKGIVVEDRRADSRDRDRDRGRSERNGSRHRSRSRDRDRERDRGDRGSRGGVDDRRGYRGGPTVNSYSSGVGRNDDRRDGGRENGRDRERDRDRR